MQLESRKKFSLWQEIVVDNFAGGGGASTGISVAIGRSVDVAINHDPAAIAMHKANHPDTEHYCESVWDIDPLTVTGGRPVALCWFSPDCKHFSKAKGGKPVEKHIRGLAWVAVRWAAVVKPRVIMLENVEEFKTWGPLLKNNMPDPKRKGITFKAFINALKRLGYRVDWRELRACDYGAPTIRKRFFMIARCDGRPIVWPNPTHGEPTSPEVKSGRLKPWRTAAEIIDWSLPCHSIFERKRPLAENTMRRIARGIQKFVIDNPEPFVIKVNHHGADFRGQSIKEPLQTITAKNGWGIVTPYISRIGQTGFGGDRMQYDIEQPLTTITTKAEHLLIAPTLMVNTTGHPGSRVDDPIRTITTGNQHALISPTLIQMGYGDSEGRRVLDLGKPLGTITAGGNKFALATAVISRQFGNSVGHSMNEPLGTVTAGGGGKSQLVTAFLAKHYGGGYTGSGADLNKPLPTVTTVDHSALVTSHLVKMKGTNIGQPVTEPIQTITAGGLHFGEVRAFLMKYYGTGEGQSVKEPLHTVSTKDRFGLVTVHGQDYQIVDIGMRMLEPRELFNAQGFPTDYIIDQDCEGKRYPKSAQVARCGNAVPPSFAEALVRANLPELCESAADDRKRVRA
ncbi:DNA (cytosine-5)-methyltransferase 1 [Sporomusaceae bacterium BoRhaA]|uniref:DNA cytosine methyltransferase n=1 Tax=Pelorhabdus rhamnosifermentans TaxID=2772457 RepID=UPI001C060A2D|nr:DNA cytosine methyltransferase [Pelorhabdus rhamnosifermentans]MBU2704092.1 DNA (cytosine-5)-methyltransferase 1 [Pelorhabdus rhamnosifermentans]